jgi:ribonuclease BN (tRNA processing enzyme)
MHRLLSLLLKSLITVSVVMLANESRGQPTSVAPSAKSGTRLITLGTSGGPIPVVGRAQSSNLLIVNGALYIIDAGPGVTRRLTRAGISIRDIDNIFITHAHDDHTGGLAELLSVEWDLNRTKPVNIYGPPGTETLVKGAMQYLTVSSDIRISDGTKTVPIAQVFVGHDMGTGAVYQDANVKVTAVENTHFHFPPSSPAYGKYKSYSYRFEASDRVVVFTGDTGPSAAVTELARGADLLVPECCSSVEEDVAAQIKAGRWQLRTPEEQANFIRHDTEEHLSADEVAKMAARADVKTVVFTHVGPDEPKDDFKRFVDQVKKQFRGKVLVAKDLMEF